MSHTSKIESIKVTDITALQAAASELNASGIRCTLVPNETPRSYYSSQEGMGNAAYVLKLEDSRYDVGFYLNEDGKSYQARTDFWGDDVQKQIGSQNAVTDQAKMGKLYSLYAAHASMRAAVQQGYTVSRTNNEDGSIRLVVAA